MNKNYKKLWLLLSCAVIPFQGILAQDADDDGEIIDLSPFVVTGDGDIGYQATSTLAGTRLRSDLRDIGSSISIVNEEFLQDTGATTIADVLLFTPNTEVGGISGNFSASQGFGAGNPIPELQRDSQQGGITRVRGLAQADLTRDYFITDVPFDAYNTDRITVQRGANSALFGLGSPGGIVNNTTIRANFLGNVGRVKLETDEHGTQRASIRYNYEVIEDTLAVRIAGLYDDNQYEQKQAFEVDKRIFASALWNITDNLRLSANIEHGSRNSTRPDYTPPNDGITPWLLAGKPIAENPEAAAALFRGTGDFFPPEASNSTNSRLFSVAVAGASSGFTNFYGDPTNPDPTFAGTQFVRANRGTPGNTEYMMIMPRPMNRIINLTGGFLPGGGSVDPAISGFYTSANVDRQILDRSIYDYRKNLFSSASSQGSDFRIISGALEGAWWDNKIGFELAAYDQQFDSWGFNMLQGIEQRTLYIDPNRYLIAKDASGNWIPNPGFGKPAMGGGYGGNDLYSNRESLRATVFAELAADDFLEESLVTRILGRLKLTGVLQERSSDSKQAYGGRGGIDPQTAANALAGGDIFGLSNATYRKGLQFTLPDSGNVDYLSMTSLSDARGANIGGVTFGRERNVPPSPSTFVGWDSESESFVSFETPVFTLRDNDNFLSSFFSSKARTEIDSKVLVGQHYLWDDTIVLMGTWRNDRQKSGTVGAPGWQPYGDGRTLGRHEDVFNEDFVAGVTDISEDADEDTTSWSIMIHTPEFIRQHMPAGTELSIYKSKADNFQPSGSRVNIFDENIAPVTGSTEEQGFILSTLEGKLVTRVNWYETGQLNNSFDVGGVSAYAGILVDLVEQLDNPANVDQGFSIADAQAVLPPEGVQSVSGFIPNWEAATASQDRKSSDNGTQDFTAEGVEIEISYNPTPKWTMLMTIAKQETVTSNTYPVIRKFVEDFVNPVWVNSSFAQNYFINEDATLTLAERAQTQIVDPVQQAITLDGIPQIEQRKWRVNFNTSYNFGRNNDLIPDWLGNFTIGGGIRWQDEIGIGFGVAENELGNLGFDPNQPFKGPSQTFVDLFFRSTYDVGENQLTVQLNIKDLTDHDELVPFYANPDGSRLYRFLEGRLVTASVTYSF